MEIAGQQTLVNDHNPKRGTARLEQPNEPQRASQSVPQVAQTSDMTPQHTPQTNTHVTPQRASQTAPRVAPHATPQRVSQNLPQVTSVYDRALDDPLAGLPTHSRTSIVVRPRGLVANVNVAVTQPGLFYRTLAGQPPTQWLLIAVIIFAVVGLAAVRYDALRTGANGAPTGPVSGGGEAPSGGGGGPIISGIPGGGGGVVIVPGGGAPGGEIPGGGGGISTPSAAADPAKDWTTALMAGSNLVVAWLGVGVLFGIVALLRARAPDFALNMRAAVWATLPFGLMAVLQLIYFAAGGTVGNGGLQQLLLEAPGYREQSVIVQDILYSLAGQFTVFWLWHLSMVYLGARFALRGRRFAAGLVVLVWAVLLVFVPIISGVGRAPEVPMPDPIALPTDPAPGVEPPPDEQPATESPAVRPPGLKPSSNPKG